MSRNWPKPNAASPSPPEIARLNPNTRTAPVFRSRADADLTAKIYARVPVLVEEAKSPAGNPWGVSFARLFDMANDSALFRTAACAGGRSFVRQGGCVVAEGARPRQGVLAAEGGGPGLFDLPGAGPRPPRRYLPLYEAKMIHQFDHRWVGYAEDGERAEDIPAERKRDPGFEPTPRYWVPEEEVEQRLRAKGWSRGWLLGWRDITNATNERTVIATVFPRVGWWRHIVTDVAQCQ